MSDGAGEAEGAILDRALRGASGLRVPDVLAPGDEELVAYLSGALSPEGAARVERALVTGPAARRRLGEVADRLDVLQAAPWAEVEAAQDGVARAWRRLTASRLEAAPAARGRWFAAGWETLRAQAAAGVADAQAAWAAFLSFADGWERARRVPRFSEARGSDGTPPGDESLPEGVMVATEAEVTSTGDLTARAWVRDPAGQSSAALDGQTVRLALAAGGDAWPIAFGEVRGGTVSWQLAGAGTDLGLAPGPLAGLRVVSGVAAPASAGILFAADGEGGGVRVDLQGRPWGNNGRLRLVVALPTLTRLTQVGRLLAVSVAVNPGVWQRLGAWPVSDWGNAPRAVEAPWPGPDGDLDPALLRLHLEASA